LEKELNMKKILIASAVCSVASLGIADVRNTVSQSAPLDRVIIFRVPLRCPAAPQIGCGSSAKLILLELERDPQVSEAWLNRAGTLLAVLWKLNSNAGNLAEKLKSQLGEAECCASGFEVTELEGDSRDEALREFQSGGWYRAADVDRLSEEEAGIIAARLVGRVEAKTTLTKDKARGLQRSLRDALSKRLIAENGKQNYELELGKIAKEFLDKRQTVILKEAIESGLRPLPNEK
jgi:hypothetical protein